MSRPKGVPNRKTFMLSEKLEQFNMDPIRGLSACLEELESIACSDVRDKIAAVQTKANIWTGLMSYIYPKRKAIDLSSQVNDEKHIVWDFRFGDDDAPRFPMNSPSMEDNAIKK